MLHPERTSRLAIGLSGAIGCALLEGCIVLRLAVADTAPGRSSEANAGRHLRHAPEAGVAAE